VKPNGWFREGWSADVLTSVQNTFALNSAHNMYSEKENLDHVKMGFKIFGRVKTEVSDRGVPGVCDGFSGVPNSIDLCK
jgi:hypothetical protein